MEINLEITQKVDRLAEIKSEQERLKLESAEIEGYLLKVATKDLENTKLKSVSYFGSGANKVTATMSESLKPVYPSYYKMIFGAAYADAVTEETKYKLSAPAARMLTGLWQNKYTRMSVKEVINQLPCDGEVKNALAKKLKGASFKTDVKNLLSIGGFSESDAEQYAYFIAEAAVWDSFYQLMKVNGTAAESDIENIIEIINGAIVVEETPKIQIEFLEN